MPTYMEDLIKGLSDEVVEKYASQIETLTTDDAFKVESVFQIDKAKSDLSKGQFVGIASGFGNEDEESDVIDKDAFDESLAEFEKTDTMPGMFFNHNRYGLQVGEWLEIKKTNSALIMKGQLWVKGMALDREPSPEAEQIRNSFLSKGPKGLSVGGGIDHRIPGSIELKEVGKGNNRRLIRVIKKAVLDEVSPVSFPANKKAKIKMIKSCDLTIRMAEDALMSGGFSAAESKHILAKGYSEFKREAELSAKRDARDPITKGQINYQLNKLSSMFSKGE